ncbi:hypothetical protein DAEQUDRAFT_726308 [Daedalea quercina L-15889]|uniref:Saccharopine dehydrogenase NADP binding domain-containing protein n=1 Tax=Daedalea quercina L-15889 TaxID=1314783 RepID=A0A165QMG7_9APHY|nr:hypothetical protein DAEQUDRAFT_726308 [Daedalea quercina L-15889]
MEVTDIIVLGATGFTGRLITSYLAHHPQRAAFTFSVAGRSETKLKALKKQCALDDAVRLVRLDVTKEDEVEEAVKGARVVLNAVGPFIYWGEAIIKACLKHHRQYVDLSGETPWIRDMVFKYDYVAHKAGVLFVHSCGFDSVPADIIVFLSNKTLKAATGSHASLGDSLTVYRANGGFSGGTLASALAIAEEVPLHKLQESNADYAFAPATGKSGPKDKLWYHVPFSEAPKRYAMNFFMATGNRAIVQRSWALNVAAAARAYKDPVSAEGDDVARSLYGQEFTYDECLEQWHAPGVLGWLSVTAASLVFATSMALLLFAPPVRWLFKRLARPSGQGPSEEHMKIGFFEITNYANSVVAPGVPGPHVKTVMHGRGDPGYELSAKMVAECALSAALEGDKLPRMAKEGGMLTPATAFGDVLVKRLEASGAFTFESDVFTPEQESRKRR